MKQKNEIQITIDQHTIDEYCLYYFKMHPRAKKKPISAPQHPSINTYTRMSFQAANNLKQKWKDFIVWVIKALGYENLQIKQCEITYRTFFFNNRRHDLDNISPKYILDGLVESGFIVDDDFRHITKLVFECDIDKVNPRIEFVIKICDKENL